MKGFPQWLWRVLVFALVAPGLKAQSRAPYFQQEVHYTIQATLDDEHHTLQSHISIRYINHSPDTLEELTFHLWPNAYSQRHTAFAQQSLRMRNPEFYFAPEEDLGGLSGLNFQVNQQQVSWEMDTHNPDIAYLKLPAPLHPGDSILVETPFTLRIPASFSRLGREGTSYQFTQWYPKPAVIDHKGVHAMPYLDMGEFYSEFGSFDVSITLPANYTVAATGNLQTESEQQRLRELLRHTADQMENWPDANQEAPFPPSSPEKKTIRFTADRVHDFAWFADKRFFVTQKDLILPSGRTVETWAFFTPYQAHLWKDAVRYVARAVDFYSEKVGEYPWPQATAVEGALSAGGGMEYPMITIIGSVSDAKALDEVITHEVGHNWFYGILASNERDHAWLDEGINSWYEKRYMTRYYSDGAPYFEIPRVLRGRSRMSLEEAAWLLLARRHQDQAPETPSAAMSGLNYFIGAYSKPAIALGHLQRYLGSEKLDAAMQAYFQKWQFRHPYPEDFRATIDSAVGKNTDWFFDGLLFSNRHLDYRLRQIQRNPSNLMVRVGNAGKIAAPFELALLRNDSVVWRKWYEGSTGAQKVTLPQIPFDRISLDPDRITTEFNRRNDHIWNRRFFNQLEPLRIRLIPAPEDDLHTTLFATPLLGGNVYDGLSVGAAFYNTTLPERPWEWVVVPFYASGSKSMTGIAHVQRHFYPAGKVVHGIHVGVNGRSFHFQENELLDYRQRYTRIMPFLRLELHRPATSALFRSVEMRVVHLMPERPAFSADGVFSSLVNRPYTLYEWSYRSEQRRTLNPRSLFLALEHQQTTEQPVGANYWKASAEWKAAFTYAPKREIRLRLFAGGFVTNERRNRGAIYPEAFKHSAQGFNDYRFDDYYFGRMATQGFWSQQIHLREGGMKVLTGPAFSTGRSNNFIVAANLIADLPIPIKPYFDLGYFDNAMPTGVNSRLADQILWSGGLALELGKGVAGIYFPLVNSPNLELPFAERGGFFNRVAFTLDLNRLNPYDLIQRAIY